jgi:hypothetical protein
VPDRLRFVTQEVDIRLDAADLARAIVSEGGSGGLIVIDTLAHAMPNMDENAPADMSALVAACDELRRLTRCAVLLVHHSGKDASRGERGHSSLRGALDTSIEVVRESESGSARHWQVRKAKDGADGRKAHFELREVTFGTDDEGDELSSCVVVPVAESTTRKRPKPPTGANQKTALEVLGELLREAGERRPDGAPDALPINRPAVTFEAAVQAIGARLTVDDARRGERARAALGCLQANGNIRVEGGFVWIR